MTEPTPPTTSSVDPGPTESAAPRRKKAYAAAVPLIALVVLALDQLTKYLAVKELTGEGRVDVVGDLFGFYLIRNPGAAFSMATGSTWIFSVVAIAVAVFIIRISRTLGHWGWAVALGLLLGGAVGNLTDRVFRTPGLFRGHVVDFLELPNWPIFNLADCSITCAAVLIAVLSIIGIGIDGRRVSSDKAAPEKTAPETKTAEKPENA